MTPHFRRAAILSAAWLSMLNPLFSSKRPEQVEKGALDRYIQESLERGQKPAQASSGSLWSPASRLTDLGTDLRAAQIDDLVTIVVAERASAIAKGTTKTARQSSVKSSVSAAGGVTRAVGPFANLAGADTDSQLNGEGTTTRETALSTTLSARVTHILPNGYLALEGVKDVQVNSERQVVTVRGVIRPADLKPGNFVRSDQIAQLEIKVNGRGVVGDAIRRPFILYRILLGLLPF